MELIEIIKSSLSIFSTTVLFFIIISYTIYKIKDSSRTKPNLKFNVQNPNPIVNSGIGVKIEVEARPIETMQFNRVLLNKLPIQDRFTIINGNVTISKPRNKKENSIPSLNANFNEMPEERVHKLDLITR
jgi:hypothetical protein